MAFLRQGIYGIRDLYFTASACGSAVDEVEDGRCKHIAANDSEIGGRLASGGFFDESLQPLHACRNRCAFDDAVAVDVRVGHRHDGYNLSFVALLDVNKLANSGWIAVDDVVREEDGKRPRRPRHCVLCARRRRCQAARVDGLR